MEKFGIKEESSVPAASGVPTLPKADETRNPGGGRGNGAVPIPGGSGGAYADGDDSRILRARYALRPGSAKILC